MNKLEMICILVVCTGIGPLGCANKSERGTQVEDGRSKAPVEKDDDLKAMMEKLRHLHVRLGPPRPGDWLEVHDEPGQTFDQYAAGNPVRARGVRRTIYIQPIGRFSAAQRRIITLTAEFMGIYFGLPVRVRSDLPVDATWPEHAKRIHPSWGDEQLLTGFIIDSVLKPRLPEDAATYLGLTTMDLWPGQGWNFVFGQASLRDRVGVWSIYRNGNPEGAEEEAAQCLRRTVKTATHETGHMFSMLHCIAYECNMCGSNSRSESDRRPLPLCPECLAKLVDATGVDPIRRFEKLAGFCRKNGLDPEARFYETSLEALKAK